MPLLKNCFCCSLLQGSIVTGVYTTVVYLAAFVLELSLVLEGENWVNSGREKGPLPLPAYILVVLHFTIVGLSVIMLYALYQRRIGVLLAWVFIFTLLFFPELGIVLFVVIFHWGLPNTYGLAEIVFYLVRAPVNVICILCVHSLHALWRSELSTERSLKKLSTLQMIKDTAGKSYKNSGYLGSSTDISSLRSLPIGNHGNGAALPYGSKFSIVQNATAENLSVSMNSLEFQKGPGLARRYSTVSQSSDYRSFYPRCDFPVDPAPNYRLSYAGSWDPLCVQSSPITDSEFNASLFPVHQRLGSMPILSHSRSEQTIFQDPRYPPGYGRGHMGHMSHMMPQTTLRRYPSNQGYDQAVDYYNMGTMSRSLLDPEYSMGYRRPMVASDYSTQSLDRRRYIRRSQSCSMDPYTMQGRDSLQHVFYGYPRRQESKNSLGAESDDFRRYRDVAL